MSDQATLSMQEFKLFETLPDPYLAISPDLIILAVSNAYLALTDTRRANIQGKPLHQAFPENDRFTENSLITSLQTVLATQKAHHMEVHRYPASNNGHQNKPYYGQATNMPILNAQGQIQYIIHKVDDVTDLVNIQITMASARSEAEHRIQAEHIINEQKTELHKKAKQAVKFSNETLQSVLDTSLIGMSILKAVRNNEGDIQDFRIMLTNRQLERETQRTDLIGKLYKAEYPGIETSGLYAIMLE